jgi:DNA-binding transcriptional MerR regulator
MRIVDGEMYLSPLEASAMLGVSYKTLQRWATSGWLNAWVGTNGKRRREKREVNLDVHLTPTGYRLYGQKSLERLRASVITVETKIDEAA